jgi:hypothetical protein
MAIEPATPRAAFDCPEPSAAAAAAVTVARAVPVRCGVAGVAEVCAVGETRSVGVARSGVGTAVSTIATKEVGSAVGTWSAVVAELRRTMVSPTMPALASSSNTAMPNMATVLGEIRPTLSRKRF